MIKRIPNFNLVAPMKYKPGIEEYQVDDFRAYHIENHYWLHIYAYETRDGQIVYYSDDKEFLVLHNKPRPIFSKQKEKCLYVTQFHRLEMEINFNFKLKERDESSWIKRILSRLLK